ncbi:MAG: PEGA domain-containing protein [Deltaproteobacteria bacterium]|nr:PEGA domain-containing protein [Deltaproteobacteria bacterium]
MFRVLAFALVVGWVGSADAAPKRKVKVVTVPAGATVYIGTTEESPACTPTPCSIDLAPGETSIVIDLKDHQREYGNVVVPKRGKVADAVFTLRAAIGTIVVDGPVGATVTIDGDVKGKAPVSAEVAAEGHHVVIVLKGKTIYDDYVDVVAGSELNVVPKKVASDPPDEGGDGGDAGDGVDGEDPGEDGDGETGDGAITEKVTAPSRRDRYLSLSALVDIGFRDFSYADAGGSSINTGSFDEAGQVLVGPGLELWPGSMAGIRFLRGLSIMARYQYGINKQPVTAAGLMNRTNTFWQSMELSLRHRWTFFNRVTAELGGGYVRDQYQFEGLPNDIAKVPDVDYKAFRVGARISVLLPFKSGLVEPFLTFENRSIRSGGKLEAKFTRADPSGFRASVGIAARFGKITARIEAAAIQYSWDLEFDSMSPTEASSATDAIRVIGFSAGYEY